MAKLKKSVRAKSSAGKSNADLQAKAEQMSRSIVDSAQQIWMAGVGAFTRAQGEGSKLFEALVKEGMNIEQTTRKLSEALRFMEALGERNVADLTRVDFYTSHEGLNLHYESAQTRQVPWRPGWYDLTTHLPWIGERTRALDGAHVEFFRGIRNPVGVKLGPSVSPDDAVRLAEQLNPKLMLRLFHSGPGTFWTNMGEKGANLLIPAPGAPANAEKK